MAGNAIGDGVVLDLSRHLNRVTAIDVERRTVTVDAGTVLDDMQRSVASHGLMFGPDPSSHSRATIGGMIGNDACGNHSVAFGRTGSHVVALDAVLGDGTRVQASAAGLRAVDPREAAHVERIERELADLAHRHLAAIRTELDTIPRQVSGYHLHHLLPERGFHVARALVGSEGTLAVVHSATLALVERPCATTLVVVAYDDLIQAAEDVMAILEYSPSAIEGMDEAIVETMRRRRGASSVSSLPNGHAWLYVEFDGEDEAASLRTGERLVNALNDIGRAREARIVLSPDERASLWRVREDGAGLASNLLDGDRSWPGWEDAAVAPQRLARYLRDFRELLAVHGFTGVLYGHFGAGCVHVRINFDIASSEGLIAMGVFIREAAALVTRHGGTLSGEHGDGRARSELLPIMYSPRIMGAFKEFKRILDPGGVLNPGVIVDPGSLQSDILPAARRVPATFEMASDGGDLARAAGRCVGIGRCVAPAGGVMCPSYRATREEKDSTRGRARALQEFMSATSVIDTQASSDVLQTLDLCLSCKACAVDCPTGIDMATYKSEFLHRHYRRRIRPASHYSLGWLPVAARTAAWVAPVANSLLSLPPLRRLAPLVGVTDRRDVPRFASRRSIRRQLRAVPRGGADALLFVDTFTRSFRPALIGAAARVLADAGISVSLAPQACCAITWITTGQLDVAGRVLRRTTRKLADPSQAELPIIALEPSCASTLVTDLPELVKDDARAKDIASRVVTFDQALHELASPTWTYPQLPEHGVLQTHCHENVAFRNRKQGTSLRSHGMSALDEVIGCCGLAGNFGFEAKHYETSIAVADVALTPALDRASADAVVLADGFGCRAQIEHLRADLKPVHLAELLDTLIAPR